MLLTVPLPGHHFAALQLDGASNISLSSSAYFSLQLCKASTYSLMMREVILT